ATGRTRGMARRQGTPRRGARCGRAIGVGGGGGVMRLFCFGYGSTADAPLHRLAPRDITVAGTRTGRAHASQAPPGPPPTPYAGDVASAQVRRALADTTHVLVSIPPDLEGDVVLRHYGEDLQRLPQLVWVGYLSTIGVYGDCRGAWVDEASPVRPTSERSWR